MTKQLLTLALCGAWVGLVNVAVAQPEVPGATTQRSSASVSDEQQQAINNKIRRTAPGGEDRSARSQERAAAQLWRNAEAGNPRRPPAHPRDFTGAWTMIDAHIDLIQDDGEQAPFNAAEAESTRALMKAEETGEVVTDASTQCFPHGFPRLTIAPAYVIRFVYWPGTILMLHEVGHEEFPLRVTP